MEDLVADGFFAFWLARELGSFCISLDIHPAVRSISPFSLLCAAVGTAEEDESGGIKVPIIWSGGEGIVLSIDRNAG